VTRRIGRLRPLDTFRSYGASGKYFMTGCYKHFVPTGLHTDEPLEKGTRLVAFHLRLAVFTPLWFEITVDQPSDWLNHRCNRLGHMGEIYMGQIVAGPMVITVQAVT
jgi:hypothetical protein